MTGAHKENLGGEIVLIRGAISNPGLVIDQCESEDRWFVDSYTGYDDGKPRRYSTSTVIHNTKFIIDLQKAYIKYAELLNYSSYPILGSSGANLHIVKYLDGGHIPPHTDEDYTEDNGIKSVIIYFNNNYDGGEVGFSNYNIEIKPNAGDILIFPCHYIHYSNPAKNGFKYMAIHKTNEFF